MNGNLVRLDEIWKNFHSKEITPDYEDEYGEWSFPTNKLYVNSLNEKTMKIMKQPVKRLYRQKINEKINIIKLENGSTLKITKRHKLYTENGWTNNFTNSKYVLIPNILINSGNSIGKELAYLLGWQFGNMQSILIKNADSNILKKCKNCLSRISQKKKLKINKLVEHYPKNKTPYLRIYSNDYIKFLKDGGYICKKQIPNKIMNALKDEIRIFLRAYFDKEAYVNIKNKSIEISSISEKLIQQLVTLLKLFEINMVYRSIKNYFVGFIQNDDLRDYRIEIGFELAHKKKSLNSICKLERNPNKNKICGDFRFSKISKIYEINYDGFVYDLEIEKHHSFVVQGAIASNTCAGIAIAERFKQMVQKYNTKIYVLVSGPLIKENWKNELLKCTGETYLKEQDKSIHISAVDKQRARKNAINIALQYYRFMSYRSFYKKVLGEKIVEKIKTKDNKIKLSYRKTKEGEFERDIAIDKIYDLNNSLIIVDEAHNLTGNAYGEALMKIIKKSQNLKIVLLTATPMKNLADDIIELINFIRPINSPLVRDKIFNRHKNHLMNFKPGGVEYLKMMTTGFVSYLRGADPLTFAKRVEKGKVPKGLLFTKVVSCKMLPFQKKIYDEAIREKDDTLDRRSEAVANFAFPGLSQDRTKLVGYYGREGINIVKNQLKTNYETLNKKISSDILKSEYAGSEGDLISISENGKTITGEILKIYNLKYFSIKFYKALKKINRLVWGKKGARTAFIYSNLVKVGIELFTEILLQNGYLEYDENPSNYQIKSDTKCYFCGDTYKQHQQKKLKETSMMERIKNISESSTEYEKVKGEPPFHNFYPATFISVTGKSAEDAIDIIPEDKQKILNEVFSSIENRDGRYIKFVLGSKVMGEGISLQNVAEIHILDVYFNLGKVDQVVGRAIRHCSHYNITTDEYRYPDVKVYKYAVTVDNGLSSEEELYKKAELKYMLIKKVERALKTVAIDCPLNISGNIFPEDVEKYKNCVVPGKNKGKDKPICPSICDYTKCDFICEDPKLNTLYFDKKMGVYKKITKNNLDYSTFTQTLARAEIEIVKTKIKDMYRFEYVYTLKDIIQYIKGTYEGEKRELFDEFFVFKALDELIPITENDFNNYNDTIFDKYNRPGYIIYIKKYYIFQPFDLNNDVPMYYRSTYDKPMQNQLSLYNYLKNTVKYKEFKGTKEATEKTTMLIDPKLEIYDFQPTIDYYEGREENKYVGIIDKEPSRRKSKRLEELKDVFKIRKRRSKILEKKRGTGIPSLMGAVCSTSKSREYLEKLSKEINVDIGKSNTRIDICEKIKDRLLFLEKYSTGKNKITYIMIPANHKLYPFPYNLIDRAEYIKEKIKEKIKFELDITVKQEKQTVDGVKNLPKITITIKNTPSLDKFKDYLESLGARLLKGKWIIILK